MRCFEQNKRELQQVKLNLSVRVILRSLAGLLLVIIVLGFGSNALAADPDGTLDPTFISPYSSDIPTAGPNPQILQLALQKDGKILAVLVSDGYSSQYTLIRLNKPGNLDPTFSPISFENGANIYSLGIQDDGKILIGGFYYAGGYLARYNSNGSPDTSFNNTVVGSPEINSSVFQIVPQTDGKILVAGQFSAYNGFACEGIVRLNPNGSVDPSFNCGGSNLTTIRKILLQNDGKILVAGCACVENIHDWSLVRLNSNGSLDSSFNSGILAIGVSDVGIRAVAEQNDGKILVTGITAPPPNNWVSKYFVRLNTNGSLDSSFSPPVSSSFLESIAALGVQRDNKILIAGFFQATSDGQNRSVGRLNPDGSLDPSFNFVLGDRQYINAMVLQTDNKVLIAGYFATSAGYYIARLQNTAKVDSSLSLASSSNFSVYGKSVSLTATLSSTSPDLPGASGTVTFSIPGIGSFPVAVTNGIAEYVTNTLPAGNYGVTAGYSGDNYYKPGASTNLLNLVVEKVDSTSNLTSSANPALVGRTITFSTLVGPLSDATSGTVSFIFNYPNGTSFSSGPLAVVGGVASYITQTLEAGDYTVTANYNGDANHLPSSSAAYTQYIITGCDPLVVTSSNDDGQASTCGTLSYALAQTLSGKISFELPAGANNLNFNGTLTSILKPGVAIDGGTNGIVVDGQGASGDGLRLSGNNKLTNLTIRGFSGRELVISGKANRLYGVKIES